MEFDDLLKALTPEKYENLKRGIELGKWADGRALTEDEKSLGLQLLIAWDARHKAPDDRIGYIEPKDGGDDAGKLIHRE